MSQPSSHVPSPPGSAATSPSYRGAAAANSNINRPLSLSGTFSSSSKNNTSGGMKTNNNNKSSLFDSKQHTIDVLTQELNGARASAKRSQDEVALLRHQLGVLRGQLSSVATRGGSTRPPVEEAWIIFCRSVLAMTQNQASSTSNSNNNGDASSSSTAEAVLPPSPNSTILRTLHQGNDIEVPVECDYVQLSALAEACRVAQPHVRRLTMDLNEGSHSPFVNATITSLSSLQELSCSRVNDTTMISVLVPAISAHPELEVLELPRLMISDQGALQLKKALSERHVLADAGSASHLRPMTLDFSECYFKEPAKFTLYGGDLETLILDKQKFFTFPEIRSSLEASAMSPWLTSVSVAGTMVDNRICTFLSESFPNVCELNVCDCANVTHINLKHVTHLHTDGRRVVEFNCPNLEVMASPLTHFAPASINLPKLDEISFLNATMTKREMELLGLNCGKTLTVVKFLGCRLESLETLMRQLRRLENFSLHSCKGVRDSDLKILFEPLIELDLTDNYVLTDNVLDAITACPFLERLSLKRCQNITDVGIGKLEGHPSLEYLNLLGVKKVSAAAVQRLVRVSAEHAQEAMKEIMIGEEMFNENNSNVNNNNNNESSTTSQQRERSASFTGEIIVEENGEVVEDDENNNNNNTHQRDNVHHSPSSIDNVNVEAAARRPRTTKVIDVRHATAVSTDTLIERDDDEERERDRIVKEERVIERRKKTLSAFASTYDTRVGSPNSAFRRKPSASPRNLANNNNNNSQSRDRNLSLSNSAIVAVNNNRPATKDQHRGEKSVNFVPGTDL